MDCHTGIERETPKQTAAHVALPFACCVVAVLWIVPAALFSVQELLRPSWITGLGYVLAGGIALIGNAVSLPLHAVYWWRRGAKPWFKWLVACQSLFILGCLLWWVA